MSPPRVQFTPTPVTNSLSHATTTPPQYHVIQYSGAGGVGNSPRKTSLDSGAPLIFAASPPPDFFIFNFEPPQLTEETLLEKEHNQTLAKLNFVLALVDCVLDLAKVTNVAIVKPPEFVP